MRARVTADPVRGRGMTTAFVTLVLRDGRILERNVPHALGSLQRPMSDADLEAKFRVLTAPVLGEAQTEKLVKLCWDAEKLDDVGVISRAAAKAD